MNFLDLLKPFIEDVGGFIITTILTFFVYKLHQFVDIHIENIKDQNVKNAALKAENDVQKMLENGAALAYAEFSKKINSIHDIGIQDDIFQKVSNSIFAINQKSLAVAGYNDPSKIAVDVKAETFKLLASDPNFAISTSANQHAKIN